MQWLVCQLHANELPLRHLVQHLDGATSGTRAFSGPIGKGIVMCEKLPVVGFDKIESDFPTVALTDLSTDQQYLWDISNAVVTGQCSVNLSRKDPGTLNHSRWLTTANRILRLYVGSCKPSVELQTLAMYVVKVYAPMWFLIKMQSSCKDGARHLWRTIKLSRYLSDELKAVIDPVIQRNAYFCHPANLLLAMLTDDRKEIRKLGMRRILKARKTVLSGIRKFVVPKLKFDASDYTELIDWQMCVTEPQLTSDVSEEDMMQFVATHASQKFHFPRFPCHTQAVERCVKVVTEASAAVCGVKAREGFIRPRLESRRIMPTFNTKKEYRTA